MSRLQQGISKLNSLSNHGSGSGISRLSSPSIERRPVAAAARTTTS